MTKKKKRRHEFSGSSFSATFFLKTKTGRRVFVRAHCYSKPSFLVPLSYELLKQVLKQHSGSARNRATETCEKLRVKPNFDWRDNSSLIAYLTPWCRIMLELYEHRCKQKSKKSNFFFLLAECSPYLFFNTSFSQCHTPVSFFRFHGTLFKLSKRGRLSFPSSSSSWLSLLDISVTILLVSTDFSFSFGISRVVSNV